MLTFYQQLKADLHSLLMFETSCEAEAKILFIAPNRLAPPVPHSTVLDL
jgi:hypothetical protein